MNRRRSAHDRSAGRTLGPYLALIAFVVVAGVAGFSVFERWTKTPEEFEAGDSLDGAGRVVIGSRSPAPSQAAPVANPERVYKPDEFTFYKSLGDASPPEPKLTPRSPALPPRPAAKPSPTKKAGVTSTAGLKKTYTVQVGSFADRRSADRLAGRLRRHRQPIAVHRVLLPEAGVRYRVRIGAFKTRDEALKFAAVVKKTDRLEPFVALAVR